MGGSVGVVDRDDQIAIAVGFRGCPNCGKQVAHLLLHLLGRGRDQGQCRRHVVLLDRHAGGIEHTAADSFGVGVGVLFDKDDDRDGSQLSRRRSRKARTQPKLCVFTKAKSRMATVMTPRTRTGVESSVNQDMGQAGGQRAEVGGDPAARLWPLGCVFLTLFAVSPADSLPKKGDAGDDHRGKRQDPQGGKRDQQIVGRRLRTVQPAERPRRRTRLLSRSIRAPSTKVASRVGFASVLVP